MYQNQNNSNNNSRNQNALAVVPEAALDAFRTDERARIVYNLAAKDVTPEEFAVFAMLCQRTGLDPFIKQIYAIKRSGKMTIQTGIDGLCLIATRSKAFAGMDAPQFEMDPAGGKYPISATVTVYRMVQGVRCAFVGYARWDEYAPYYKGVLGDMWAKMPFGMLAKCARAQALRATFPEDMSGLYSAEEMAQADNNAPMYTADSVIDAAPAVSAEADGDVITYTPDPEPAPVATAPVATAPVATAPASPAFDPMKSATFGRALAGIGLKTVADKETFVSDATAKYPAATLYDACKAFYEDVKAARKARTATQAQALADAMQTALNGASEDEIHAEVVTARHGEAKPDPKRLAARKDGRGPAAAFAATLADGEIVPDLQEADFGARAN